MGLEHASILHASITIVALYLFLIFGWWAIRQWWLGLEPVSKIYMFTCILMLGIACSHGGAWYGYHINFQYHLVVGDNGLMKMITVWWWPYRAYIQLFSLLAYAIYVTDRACFRKRKNFKRRIEDHL